MSVMLQLLGAGVVLTVLQDVFATVLFPGSGRGIIRKPLARATWGLFQAAGRLVHGHRRHSLLAYGGPAQIVLTLAAWFGLLLVGWAMVYEPVLGRSIVASSGPTDTSWTTALYYSGFAVTTLGTGDVVAATGGYRMLTIVEAGIGFLTFTMVISYFLSVYSSLPSRNAFAQGLHQRTRGTGDAAVLLAAMSDGQELAAKDFLASTAAQLRDIFQTHRSYPVLRHFHYRELEYGLPRMLLVALDTATLACTVLDPERYARLRRSPAMHELLAAADSLLDELAPARPGIDRCAAHDWCGRAAVAAGRLRAAGLHVQNDTDAAADYAAAREAWDPRVRALATAMLYRWGEVDTADRC